MIYSFLNTTKTARLFFLYGIGVLQLLLYRYLLLGVSFTLISLLESFLMAILLLVNISTISLLVRKNQLSEGNLLVVFYWLLLFSFFPETYQNSEVMLSNTLILFVFYQLIQLRNQIDGRVIFFNSALLIFLASFFCIPSIASLFFLWIYILIHPGERWRNMLIPVVAFICFATLSLAIALPLGLQDTLLKLFYFIPDFSVESFVQYKYFPLFGVVLINLSLTSWILAKFYKRYFSRFFVGIMLIGLISIGIFIQKNAVGTIYLTLPTALSLMITTEHIQRWWLRELLLATFIFASLAMLFLGNYLT